MVLVSAWSVGCGWIVGESFDGYSKKATSEGGVGGTDEAVEGGARDANGGAETSGGRGGASDVAEGGAYPGGMAGLGGAGLGGSAGAPETPSTAGAAGEPSTNPDCPPPSLLITDMETLSGYSDEYATLDGPRVPSGIQVSGFWCGHSPESSAAYTDSCGVGAESSIGPTSAPNEVHCGKTALKAFSRSTRRLEVNVDLAAKFENATAYAGIQLWAKGTGPFVPGLTGGGDWRGLPDLKPDVWQEYLLRWSDLEDSSGMPWTFDGTLVDQESKGHELSFQVWNDDASSDFTLLLDDISFLPR